jgi:hypothetical protein
MFNKTGFSYIKKKIYTLNERKNIICICKKIKIKSIKKLTHEATDQYMQAYPLGADIVKFSFMCKQTLE